MLKVPVPLTTPDAVAIPVPPINVAVVRVIFPEAVAAVALLFTNEPLRLMGSADVKPFKSRMAPEATVVGVVLPNASLLPNFKVPALIVVVPLKVFTPLKVQVLVPDFVNVPVPLITPDAVAIPVPPIIAAEESMMLPDAVEVPVLFTNDPLTVNGSAVVKPFKLTVAPNAIDVAPDALPKALLLPSVNVPAFTVVTPTYVFAPDNVSVPVPFLIRETCPLPSLMTPEKVVVPLFAPTVNATFPATELVMVPAPAMEPTSRLLPLRSSVPVMVMALFATGPKVAVAAPIFMVPSVMVVALVYVFAPLIVQVPAPVLVSVPELLMIPDIVASPVPPMMAAVVRVIFPEAIAGFPLLLTKDPLMVKSSAVVYPFKSTKVPNKIVVAVVVPKAASLPNFTVPPVIVVTPVYVFAPDKSQTPASFFSKVPVPLITPDAVTLPEPPIIAAVTRDMLPEAVAALALLFTKNPLIANCSAVENPFKSTIAPDAIVVAPTVLPNP